MDTVKSVEMLRELGKANFFSSDSDEQKKSEGLQMIIKAHQQGDTEATYLVSRLVFDGVLTVPKKPEEFALALMCKAANKGYVQARAFLNMYCTSKYKKSFKEKMGNDAGGPLVDFDGKVIKIKRKGVLTPIDAVLEYKDGKNILSLSTNTLFFYSDKLENMSQFEKAVLDGLYLWQGEYEVFNGQKVFVEVKVTADNNMFDNLIIMPVTDSLANAVKSVSEAVGTNERKAEIKNLLLSKRSFASSGFKWSVSSRKTIFIQSENGRFDDYDEITHVVKHEFGHALGLGDLYADPSSALAGVAVGKYAELDSYAISNRFYNLVMCDHHGPVSNNDIEMVILAFRDNKMQLFQPRKLKGKISYALGRGN